MADTSDRYDHRFDTGSLSTSSDPFDRERAATDPNLDPASLSRLGHDTELRVRIRVAMNPSTAPDTLHVLAHDPPFEVRLAVARHESTPREALEHLSSADERGVRNAAEARLAEIGPA